MELLRLFLSICLSVCYHLKVIWQPKAAQNLLWNLIITALVLMIPCRLPHSCTECPILFQQLWKVLESKNDLAPSYPECNLSALTTFGVRWRPEKSSGTVRGLPANLGDQWRPWRPSTTEKSMTLNVHGDRWRPLTTFGELWGPVANFGVPWRPKSLHLGLKMTTNINLVSWCNIKGFIMLCPDPTCNYIWMQISTFLKDLVQQHSKGRITSNSNHME